MRAMDQVTYAKASRVIRRRWVRPKWRTGRRTPDQGDEQDGGREQDGGLMSNHD
jgi:hypothetical protein